MSLTCKPSATAILTFSKFALLAATVMTLICYCVNFNDTFNNCDLIVFVKETLKLIDNQITQNFEEIKSIFSSMLTKTKAVHASYLVVFVFCEVILLFSLCRNKKSLLICFTILSLLMCFSRFCLISFSPRVEKVFGDQHFSIVGIDILEDVEVTFVNSSTDSFKNNENFYLKNVFRDYTNKKIVNITIYQQFQDIFLVFERDSELSATGFFIVTVVFSLICLALS